MANHKKERIDQAQGLLYFIGREMKEAYIEGGEVIIEVADGTAFYIVGCKNLDHLKTVFPKTFNRVWKKKGGNNDAGNSIQDINNQ